VDIAQQIVAIYPKFLAECKPTSTVNCNNNNNCSHVCAYHCAQFVYTMQHRTVLIIFPVIIQTVVIAQMSINR